MPVFQDAITAADMDCRYTAHDAKENFAICKTTEQADAAYTVLTRMLKLGADIRSHDSYGNSCLGIAVLNARQILSQYSHVEH